MNAPNTPEFLSFADACAVLGIPERTGRDLVARGEFPVPTIKVGRRRKVALYQLVKLAEGDAA